MCSQDSGLVASCYLTAEPNSNVTDRWPRPVASDFAINDSHYGSNVVTAGTTRCLFRYWLMRLSGKHFPEIPQSWRLPIVISSTTAVRQAAVMHVVSDANAGSPDPYKSALSFWALGLCALPRRAPQLHSESAQEADREHIPITIVDSATLMPENLFRSWEVTVPIVASDSGFLEFYTSVSDQDASSFLA